MKKGNWSLFSYCLCNSIGVILTNQKNNISTNGAQPSKQLKHERKAIGLPKETRKDMH